MTQPIGYHFTMLTATMAVNGVLKPNIIRVESPEQALEAAKRAALNEDISECSFGCLTVFDDGSVSHDEYTMSELEF